MRYPEPLICTNTTQGHIDYGIPISMQFPDYRTTYSTYHRYIPPKRTDFDCSVKLEDLRSIYPTEYNIKDQNYDTTYNFDYQDKRSVDVNDAAPGSLPLNSVNYSCLEQERFFKDPPHPIKPKISEMKSNYLPNEVRFEYREVFPPNPNAYCEIRGLGRDEQPPIRPDSLGYYKYLDPYLTTNAATYVPFSYEARKRAGNHLPSTQAGKGNKMDDSAGPLVPKRPSLIYDKLTFPKKPTDQIQHVPPKTLECAKKSVYRNDYIPQTFSDAFPKNWDSGDIFPDSRPDASPWQNLAPTGMYCTEQCHIGTGWPVRAVVDIGLECPKQSKIVHKQCFTKFCDWMF